MMYRNSQYFEKEFIQRTKHNILVLEKADNSYDVTHFINSMLGLLIIPKERHYEQIDDSMIESALLHEIQACCRPSSDLKFIVKKMRNAVTHGHLDFAADTINNMQFDLIKTVIFRDYSDYNASHPTHLNFEAEIEINLLKRFILSFADAVQNCINAD